MVAIIRRRFSLIRPRLPIVGALRSRSTADSHALLGRTYRGTGEPHRAAVLRRLDNRWRVSLDREELLVSDALFLDPRGIFVLLAVPVVPREGRTGDRRSAGTAVKTRAGGAGVERLGQAAAVEPRAQRLARRSGGFWGACHTGLQAAAESRW